MDENMKTERNYGIDLLRVFSMFQVVILHVLGCGGILSKSTEANYLIGWLCEITMYSTVDCHPVFGAC